jgi:hypothetical protein
MDPGTGLMLIRHLIATKVVLCDMSLPIELSVRIDQFEVNSPN